ncbi:hypothetical protein [Stappia stellulata]|uniref:hypothetical protein n=1 Tax=Stappia stellulata TaxID=71235 RepID=UPI000490C3C8|nr:hypothetical protein [Stappia stellulata]
MASDRKSSGKKRRATARTIGDRTNVLIEALPNDAGLVPLKKRLKQVQAVARLLSLPDAKAASQTVSRREKKRRPLGKSQNDPCAKDGL